MKALSVIGGIVVVGLLIIFFSIFSGYVLSVLWGWFMVPTFGVPKLSIVPAIGIAIGVSFLTHQQHHCKKEERSISQQLAEEFFNGFVYISLTLFFGWVVHLYM